MEGVGLRVKNEGKCVSSYCPFDIEVGDFFADLNHMPFDQEVQLLQIAS